MRIAFAGNPNSGKTTMYNALTGRNEKVGNWAGVTVDKKEALIKKTYAGDQELIAVDLPGAYSMSLFIPVALHLGGEHHQLLCPKRAPRCHHQHCGCHQSEPFSVFHHPAAGAGHPCGGGAEQA